MSRTIRVFISSTFFGFDKARNRLVGNVFPKIRDLCRKNGFTFKAVDLRWGITENEGRNHQTAAICFEEIRRCQEYSPAPNFIVLSDDYYGWIPIPASVSSYCWEQIEKYLKKTDPAGLSFLQSWYKKDQNDLSGHFILQNHSRLSGAADRILLDNDMENRIGEIMFPAAQSVFADDYSMRVAFGGSLTEQEINLGLFSIEEARNHTLVMIRETEKRDAAAPDDSGFNAHNLNTHLKEVMGDKWISLQENTFEADALRYLENVVTKQIRKVKEKEQRESVYERETRELQEALSAAAQEYLDTGGRLEQIHRFSLKNRGQAAVVMGKQGSGKSTLFKYCAWADPEKYIGVFTDLQGNRCTIESALAYLLEVLHHRGLLKKITPKNPGESSAGYFERQLESLRKGTGITLLLDCAEQISDFRLQEESLFSMNLPEGVSFLISCINRDALTKTDLLYKPAFFEIGDIPKTEGLPMLLDMLKGYGRTLSVGQQDTLRQILPETATPLYLRHLAALLRNVQAYEADTSLQNSRSDENIRENCLLSGLPESRLPDDVHTLLRHSLEREMQVSLPGLYRHALACIALSAQGIQEEELIEVLLREMPAGSNLREEILKNSHWTIQDMEHVTNIFWSRMRFQLQHFLGTYTSHGNLLIRFRHGLMEKAALEISGARIIAETSRTVRDYWLEQEPYLFTESEQDGSEGPRTVDAGPSAGTGPIVNRRRADELVPVLKYLHEEETIGKLLEELSYLDAMIRLERCNVLMDSLDSARKGGYAGPRADLFLEILRKCEIVLTSFPGSFLPLCVQYGLSSPAILAMTGEKGYFRREKTCFVGERARADREGMSDDPDEFEDKRAWKENDSVLQLPGSAGAPMALRSDGIMAVMDRGRIRIFDWNRKRYSTAASPVTLQRYDFLYWKGSILILRRAKSRISFLYKKTEGGAGEELTLIGEEACPTLIDLFEEKDEKRRAAGDLQEEEAAGVRTERNLYYYNRDGGRRQRTLQYPLEMDVEIFQRFEQAAIVKDLDEVDFVDLEAGIVRESLPLLNVTGVFFSDDAKSVLIRTRADTIVLHRIEDKRTHPMPTWGKSEEQVEKALRRYRFLKDFSPAPLFSTRKKRDIPWQPESNPTEGIRSPILACMSVEAGWAACYYYYNNLARIRIFDLSTFSEILASDVEPIYREDMKHQPLRAVDHGRKLALRSSGAIHVLDLGKSSPSWKRKWRKRDFERGSIDRSMISDCETHMWKWIPHSQAYESLEDLTNNTFDTVPGRIGFRLLRFMIFPITFALMAEKTTNPAFIYAPEIFRTQQYLWLVDPLYRMIHVADLKGKWLCHTQVKQAFSAADVEGDTLYLLSEDKSRVDSLRYISNLRDVKNSRDVNDHQDIK